MSSRLPVGGLAAAGEPAAAAPAATTSPAAGHRDALAVTHEWFDRNSGWAPPDEGTMAEWLADGVCRCPDECLVAPAGCCEHGLASWAIVLVALADEDRAAAEARARLERG